MAKFSKIRRWNVCIFVLVLVFLEVNCGHNRQKKHAPSEDYPADAGTDVDFDDVSSSEAGTAWNNHVTPADRLHDCGLRDKCPENATTITSVIMSPEICRCDLQECIKYGDCCWSLIENRTLTAEKNLWQCHPLEFQNTSVTYAMMISECPETSRDEVTKQMCAGVNILPQNYTYLVDLPVYANKSSSDGIAGGGGGILYKNIYCALCHNEKNSHIVPWTMQLACSHEFTPIQRTEFLATAKYVPGERLWQTETEIETEVHGEGEDGETQRGPMKCALKVAELREFEIQDAIPNVRYCPAKAVTRCSETDNADDDDENWDKIDKLCSSYAQYVMHRETGKVYKNPHCALCHERQKDPIPLMCRRPSVATTFFKVRPGEAGAILPGAGLNFLFDFGLGSNKYVGYEMLCGDDEIWDYIRQKCGPMICKVGYVLQNGKCAPKQKPPLIELKPTHPNGTNGDGEFDGGGGNRTEGGDGGRSDDHDNDDDPECTKYRILLHKGDYKLLTDPPNAISILLPNDADQVPEILLETEYEHVNETTISICAKYLHRAFEVRFSTTLNYLSLVSVGLSVFFSFLHILLYILLPKLRNPPGRNLFCLTASLFTFQLLFLALFTHDKFPGLCVGSAIVMHYFSLAAFFWMNIMSFDMWRTFSCNSLLRRSHSTDGQKFFKYSLYAWCMPGLIVLTAVLLDFAVPDSKRRGADGEVEFHIDDDLLSTVKPSYGENGLCWITQRLSLFIFFAVPVALVVTSNIALFSFTANAIFSQHKESSRVFKNRSPKKVAVQVPISVDDSSTTSTTGAAGENGKPPLGGSASPSKTKSKPNHATNRDKVRLMLYVNMALIMGLGWILGFASQFLATDWLRYPFVIVNGLQGTFIFFAFDFKRKIYRMLKDRFYDGRLCKMFGLERSTSSMGIGDTSNSNSNRRGTYSNSGTRSSNLLSTSEDEKRRKISMSLSVK